MRQSHADLRSNPISFVKWTSCTVFQHGTKQSYVSVMHIKALTWKEAFSCLLLNLQLPSSILCWGRTCLKYICSPQSQLQFKHLFSLFVLSCTRTKSHTARNTYHSHWNKIELFFSTETWCVSFKASIDAHKCCSFFSLSILIFLTSFHSLSS